MSLLGVVVFFWFFSVVFGAGTGEAKHGVMFDLASAAGVLPVWIYVLGALGLVAGLASIFGEGGVVGLPVLLWEGPPLLRRRNFWEWWGERKRDETFEDKVRLHRRAEALEANRKMIDELESIRKAKGATPADVVSTLRNAQLVRRGLLREMEEEEVAYRAKEERWERKEEEKKKKEKKKEEKKKKKKTKPRSSLPLTRQSES
ncbi:hypothetical protein OHC33_003162 [Knufia fluminis]|uniref:Uncharacterized protein n=1 Tax=Knufia fluminis TaxID=191047 RepID=A0AAN8IQ00_9EURO|nr:hypothetical protein OHC33_003162 [Knufia fluminis]